MNMEYDRSSVAVDLAESVDDLICIEDGPGDRTMDTLAMFIFFWILAALFLLWLGKFIYRKLVDRARAKEAKAKLETIPTVGKPEEKSAASVDGVDAKIVQNVSSGVKSGKGFVPATPPVRKRLTRQSPGPDLRRTKYVPAPQCTGADNISVLWVNDVFQWLYNDLVIVNELIGVWIQYLNEYTKKLSAEVSYNPIKALFLLQLLSY